MTRLRKALLVEAADTNVLVRFLVRDDEAQAARATTFVETAAASGGLFICVVVLCELCWVLRSYKQSKQDIIGILHDLLSTDGVTIERRGEVQHALAEWESGPGDFADFVIAESARREGCTTVVTLDEKLHARPYFRAP